MNTQRFPILCLLVAVALAFPAAAAETRSMTLDDCIEQAIAQNLGLRVARIGPLVAQNNLSLAYAGYDPTLTLGGQHNNTQTGGGLDSDQRIIPPSNSESDSFSAGVGGLLPWGMRYDLTGRAANTSGQRGYLGTNGNILFDPFENSQGNVQASITQPLLRNSWIDGTRLNVSLAKKQLSSAKELYRQRLIDLVTLVETAYYDLVSARENLKVQQKALQLAQQLLDENRQRVQVGAMAPLEEKQAEAQVAMSQADLLAAERTLALSENALKRTLTDNFAAWREVDLVPIDEMTAVPQVFDLQDSWNKGLTMRPDIVQAWLTMEERDIQLQYSKNQLYPQLDAIVTYGHAGSDVEFSGLFSDYGDGSQPYWTVGGVLSIPISNAGARARHRNAKAQIEQSVLEMKNLEQSVMAQIDDAIKYAKVSYRRVNATQSSRAYSEAALEAEQEKLANGNSTSFEVLRLQRDLTAARSSEISALTEYNKALATLAQFEGSTLQRHAIELNAN